MILLRAPRSGGGRDRRAIATAPLSAADGEALPRYRALHPQVDPLLRYAPAQGGPNIAAIVSPSRCRVLRLRAATSG